jgi:hypothetical protein
MPSLADTHTCCCEALLLGERVWHGAAKEVSVARKAEQQAACAVAHVKPAHELLDEHTACRCVCVRTGSKQRASEDRGVLLWRLLWQGTPRSNCCSHKAASTETTANNARTLLGPAVRVQLHVLLHAWQQGTAVAAPLCVDRRARVVGDALGLPLGDARHLRGVVWTAWVTAHSMAARNPV